MKRHVATWSLIGFSIACIWVLYSFFAPAESLQHNLRDPLFRSTFITCPILFLARTLPLKFWWIPLINAATFAVVGPVFYLVRKRWADTVVSG